MLNESSCNKRNENLSMKLLCIGLIVIFVHFNASSQTNRIKELAEQDRKPAKEKKEGSREYYYEDEEYEFDADAAAATLEAAFFLVDMFRILTVGIAEEVKKGQDTVLSVIDKYPERKSIELSGTYGSGAHPFSNLFTGAFRGNYGIFATDFRHARLYDFRGNLSTIDWQILMLRIPIESVKLEFGIGFTSLYEPSNMWGENSLGIEAGLLKNRLVIKSQYRKTFVKSQNYPFRQEANLQISFQAFKHQKLHIFPIMEFTHQNYYNEFHMNFIRVGIRMSFY